MRRNPALLALAVASACSRGARKDVTPPLASDVAAAASREAALRDPAAGPALSEAEQRDHVLSRATFGARPGDRERIARIGIAAFLEEQLHPETLDDDRADAQLKDYPVLRRGAGALAHELTQKRKERQEEEQRKAKLEAANAPAAEGPITASEAAKQAGAAMAGKAPAPGALAGSTAAGGAQAANAPVALLPPRARSGPASPAPALPGSEMAFAAAATPASPAAEHGSIAASPSPGAEDSGAMAGAKAMPGPSAMAAPGAVAGAPAAAAKKPGKELRKALGRAGRSPGFDYVADLSEAKIIRAVSSERQLQEVMADFWFNHFNVFAGKENEAALLPDYEERVIRPNALGNFGELLSATAHSPAMLVYLDNRLSASAKPPAPPKRPVPSRGRRLAAAPAPRPPPAAQPGPPRPQRGLNENYARELLELHTLGVDGGYTQADIVEVARCFTGWTVDQPNEDPRFVFRPQMHDDGEKRVLGQVIPAGGGEEDGQKVLEILLAHPATARFVSTKLVRRLVSDEAPPELVESVAATFARTRGDIRSMLRTIFESPSFWSRRALRAKVRSPLELVASAVRALAATVEDPLVLARAVARIGEPLYGAQPPTGYADTAAAWMSSGALLARIDFGLQLANGQLEGVAVDISGLAKDVRGPDDVLRRAANRLGARELSDETRGYILAQLASGPKKPDVIAARAVGLLLGAPELQRR